MDITRDGDESAENHDATDRTLFACVRDSRVVRGRGRRVGGDEGADGAMRSWACGGARARGMAGIARGFGGGVSRALRFRARLSD